MEWIVENWELFIALLGAILTLAAVVTKITTTQTDDKVVSLLQVLLSALPKTLKKPVDVKTSQEVKEKPPRVE